VYLEGQHLKLSVVSKSAGENKIKDKREFLREIDFCFCVTLNKVTTYHRYMTFFLNVYIGNFYTPLHFQKMLTQAIYRHEIVDYY